MTPIFPEVARMTMALELEKNQIFWMRNSHPLFSLLWNIELKIAVLKIGHISFNMYMCMYVKKKKFQIILKIICPSSPIPYS